MIFLESYYNEMADRGYDIADSIGVMKAKLNFPAFTTGKNQLSALEIETL